MFAYQAVRNDSFSENFLYLPGVILENEGSVRKTQKRTLFHCETIKKGTPNSTFSYVHGLFTIVFIKWIFEKNKSSRAASGNWTQFKSEIDPAY